MFNGLYTVKNVEKNTHRTVRVSTVRKGQLEGKRIMSLLTGPDNMNSYQGFAFVDDMGNVQVWRKFQSDKVKPWLAAVVAQWAKNQNKPQGVDVLLSKRCLRCNRTLTTPESIERGIGPECASKGL